MNQNGNTQEDLNVAKNKGVSEFGLTQEQVNNPVFTPDILETMSALKTMSPESNGQSLFEMATEMPGYQIRAIAEQGIAPEKLGLSVENGQLIQPGGTGKPNILPEEASLLADTLNIQLPENDSKAMGLDQLGGLGQTSKLNDVPLPPGVTPLNEADTAEFLKFAASMMVEDSVQQVRELQQQGSLQEKVTGAKENQVEPKQGKDEGKLNMNAFLKPSAPKVAKDKDADGATSLKSGQKSANKQEQSKPKKKGRRL